MAISTQQFLKWFALTCAVLVGTIVVFNVLVDPFRIFYTPTVTGMNSYKPEFATHTRMSKAQAVRVFRPRGIILGSSRAEYGLDPVHPAWSLDARPVYNLALPSARIEEVRSYLEHAHTIAPLHQVIMALDLFMFNANWLTEAGYTEARLAQPGHIFVASGWLRDMTVSAFSFDAIRASISTLRSQDDPYQVPYLDNGMRHPTLNWPRIKNKGGHRAAFLSNERYALTAPDGWAMFSLGGSPRDSFRSLVAFCHRESIALHVIISPVHARSLEVLWQVGLWPVYEQWKRELVLVLAGEAATKPDVRPFPLWDFSGYNRITTEPVPADGDTAIRMKWFWEGSHYTKALGDLMITEVLAVKAAQTLEDFGTPIGLTNLDSHLQAIREARAHYVAENPHDVREIKDLVESTAAARRNISQAFSRSQGRQLQRPTVDP